MEKKKLRLIAAADSKRGIATSKGIPWDLSIDVKYFRDKTVNSTILMGYNTYVELKKPLPNRRNFVFCRQGTQLANGFIAVHRLTEFLQEMDEDLWIIGGAALFAKTIRYADELYITQIDKNFRCIKKFPEYYPAFRRISQSPDYHQNTLTFRFEIWQRVRI